MELREKGLNRFIFETLGITCLGICVSLFISIFSGIGRKLFFLPHLQFFLAQFVIYLLINFTVNICKKKMFTYSKLNLLIISFIGSGLIGILISSLCFFVELFCPGLLFRAGISACIPVISSIFFGFFIQYDFSKSRNWILSLFISIFFLESIFNLLQNYAFVPRMYNLNIFFDIVVILFSTYSISSLISDLKKIYNEYRYDSDSLMRFSIISSMELTFSFISIFVRIISIFLEQESKKNKRK